MSPMLAAAAGIAANDWPDVSQRANVAQTNDTVRYGSRFSRRQTQISANTNKGSTSKKNEYFDSVNAARMAAKTRQSVDGRRRSIAKTLNEAAATKGP